MLRVRRHRFRTMKCKLFCRISANGENNFHTEIANVWDLLLQLRQVRFLAVLPKKGLHFDFFVV